MDHEILNDPPHAITCACIDCVLSRPWPKILSDLQTSPIPWAKVRGPAGAIIMTLRGWGINMPHHRHRITPLGQWEIKREGRINTFITELQDIMANKLWELAAAHRNSQGLSLDGHLPDVSGLPKQDHQLIKKNRNSDAALLVATATGGLWPNMRIHENKPEEDYKCPLCGNGPHDETHMFWTCPKLSSSDNPAITKTQVLIPHAQRGIADGYTCCWLRGIVPGKWTSPNRPPTHYIAPLGNRSLIDASKLTIYTDGSGGSATHDPRMRRCGWAWVIVQIGQDDPIYWENGHLHTSSQKKQTVPNAEMQAIHQVLIAILDSPEVTEADIYPDCQLVVTGHTRGPKWTQTTKQADRWAPIWATYQELTEKGITIRIHKVNAHETDLTKVTREHQHGNNVADGAAKSAAYHHDLPALERRAIANMDAQAYLIRKRMIPCIKIQKRRGVHRPQLPDLPRHTPPHYG